MIAVDTNLLVYAHRSEFLLHDEAKVVLAQLAAGPRRPYCRGLFGGRGQRAVDLRPRLQPFSRTRHPQSLRFSRLTLLP